jgi:uncharacterized membrane protein YphA (DoxX/SURF4 family)
MEEIGGIVLIIGVLTRVASILFIILMIGAIITVQFAKGFIGGYRYIQYVFCKPYLSNIWQTLWLNLAHCRHT